MNRHLRARSRSQQEFSDVGSTPAWIGDALCAQTDPEAFFPDLGDSTRSAKAVCMACPVRRQCLAFALENDERFGVWGGLSVNERRALRKSSESTEGEAA